MVSLYGKHSDPKCKNIYIIAIELDMFVEKENKHVVELNTYEYFYKGRV